MATDKRERQKANREERRRREAAERRRQERLAAIRRYSVIALIAIAASATWLFVTRGGSDESASPTTTTAATTDPPADTTATTAAVVDPRPGEPVATPEYTRVRSLPVACDSTAPPPAILAEYEEPADQDIPQDASVTATISTSCGDIVVELDPAAAPETVNNFVFLAREGFYDGTASHRIISGFMLQAGDPTATGRGGPGYSLPDELPEDGSVYNRGTVAMARGAAVSGSQFFIVHGDATFLDPLYNVFGTVVEGLDVLDVLAATPVSASPGASEVSSPEEAVYIESIAISVE